MSKERPYAPPRDPDEVDGDITFDDAPEGELDFNDERADFADDFFEEDEYDFEDDELLG